jgi:hypothetical protein
MLHGGHAARRGDWWRDHSQRPQMNKQEVHTPPDYQSAAACQWRTRTEIPLQLLLVESAEGMALSHKPATECRRFPQIPLNAGGDVVTLLQQAGDFCQIGTEYAGITKCSVTDWRDQGMTHMLLLTE